MKVKIFYKRIDANSHKNTGPAMVVFEKEINEWLKGRDIFVKQMVPNQIINDRNDYIEFTLTLLYADAESPVAAPIPEEVPSEE